jgi:hypothetical protein
MMACTIVTGGGASGEDVVANPGALHAVYEVVAKPEVDEVETDSEGFTGTFARLPWSGSGGPLPPPSTPTDLLALTSYSGILGAGE